jgi:hypothetical protein
VTSQPVNTVITARAFASALLHAGIITDLNRISRITIVLESGPPTPVRIYVEHFGDSRLEELAPSLADAQFIEGAPPP